MSFFFYIPPFAFQYFELAYFSFRDGDRDKSGESEGNKKGGWDDFANDFISMLTYSGWNQPVIQRYGEENVQRLKDVQSRYDPGLLLQSVIPGGQKIPT